jgi:CBS domain-containing protein
LNLNELRKKKDDFFNQKLAESGLMIRKDEVDITARDDDLLKTVSDKIMDAQKFGASLAKDKNRIVPIDIHAVVLTDADEKPKKVISSFDYACSVAPGNELMPDKKLKNLKIGTSDIVKVRTDYTIRQVAETFGKNPERSYLVVESGDGKLVGIIFRKTLSAAVDELYPR